MLVLMSMLMSYTLLNFFVSSIFFPYAYTCVISENQA